MSQVMSKIVEKQVEKHMDKKAAAQPYAKKPVNENRRLAVKVLAAAIAVALLVIAPLKLNGYRNRVEKVFKNGTSTQYVDSVAGYVRQSSSAATDILNTYVARYGETDATRKLVKAIEQLGKASDENEIMRLYEEMYAGANEVYNLYRAEYKRDTGKEPDKSDKVYKDWDDLYSYYNKDIANNGYWEKAAKYNAARESFPANVIGPLFGIDKMPTKIGS